MAFKGKGGKWKKIRRKKNRRRYHIILLKKETCYSLLRPPSSSSLNFFSFNKKTQRLNIFFFLFEVCLLATKKYLRKVQC